MNPSARILRHFTKHSLAIRRVQVHRPHPARTYATQQPPAPPPTPPEHHERAQNIPPKPRHEAQEGNLSINYPFNPPGGGGGPGPGGSGSDFRLTGNPLLDAGLTTVIGLGMVFVGGIAYIKWYKANVLDKIELAFAAGYDPALELASHGKKGEKGHDPLDLETDIPWTQHLRRKEQDKVDAIVQGKEKGHYFVLLGPKGSGKGTMIFDAMAGCQAEGVAVCDAHPDLEVFRLRLGKALNFEYHEDSQTGLFQRRDPREGGPALDIERALNKLEKVALRVSRKKNRPLVLCINNVHYFKNDDEGRNILLQLQHRAEAWAASGILTMVFSTDDFWPFFVMRKTASRMHVLSISDLRYNEAMSACSRILRNDNRKAPQEDINGVVSILGGRLSFLNRAARNKEMVSMAQELLAIEKGWLLSQIGLIPDCDDDVMDESKWSSCSWLLLQEFVKMRQEQERELRDAIESGTAQYSSVDELPLPVIPYWRCRQIMTRPDFLEDLDRANIIAIDVNHDVKPDSMLILHAARQVVEEDGFQELLDGVRDRVDEIESLHRTRELTFKDLDKGDKVRLSVDKTGNRLLDEDDE